MNPQNAPAHPQYALQRPADPTAPAASSLAGSARRRAMIARLPLREAGDSGPSRLATLLHIV